jgi:protein TonB
MSLADPITRPAPLLWSGAIAAGVGLHLLVGAAIFRQAPEAPPPVVETAEASIEGAMFFDLSDIIAAPETTGEDAAAVSAAEDAPTVTESAEAVDPAKAADEPILNQVPYDVEDDELKFGVASPEPATDTEEIAHETATEFDEEQIEAESQLGSEARDASAGSVSGVNAPEVAEKAQAKEEGLSAEATAEIMDWQKDVVLRIGKARKYPADARKQKITGTVKVRFTIDRYGNIQSKDIAESSGHTVLDNAALKVLEDVGKLPTPPVHLRGDSFTLVVPLNYQFK